MVKTKGMVWMAVFRSRNAKLGGGAAVAVILAVVGYLLLDRPAEVPDLSGTEEAELPAPSPELSEPVTAAAPLAADLPPPDDTETPAETAQATDTEVPPTSALPADAPANAPSFDEVRRDADGVTVIAGRAAPGSDVRVLSNGKEIGSATADTAGKFATLAILPPDGVGQVLTLETQEDDRVVASVEDVILAPIAPPAPAPEAPEAQIAQEPSTPSAPTEVTATDVAPAQDGSAPDVSAPDAAVPAADADADAAADVTTAALQSPAPQQQVALLKSTEEGVELLPGSVPEAVDKVVLDTITYSEIGDVRLAGRAQTGSTSVQVYLDNAPVGSLAVDTENRWRGDLPDIDAGVYTLRVDEVNAAGKVVSRIETPFQRESAEVLALATANQTGPISAVTVQEGATLWAIARDRYDDPLLYVRVFEANRDSIRDPDLIYPGQVFSLPD